MKYIFYYNLNNCLYFNILSIPGELNITGPGAVHDEEVFASSKVTCVGQVIGIIVAIDQSTAQRAAKLVKIEYKEIQPVIITIQVFNTISVCSSHVLYMYIILKACIMACIHVG